MMGIDAFVGMGMGLLLATAARAGIGGRRAAAAACPRALEGARLDDDGVVVFVSVVRSFRDLCWHMERMSSMCWLHDMLRLWPKGRGVPGDGDSDMGGTTMGVLGIDMLLGRLPASAGVDDDDDDSPSLMGAEGGGDDVRRGGVANGAGASAGNLTLSDDDDGGESDA